MDHKFSTYCIVPECLNESVESNIASTSSGETSVTSRDMNVNSISLKTDGQGTLKCEGDNLRFHDNVTNKVQELQVCRICFETDGNLKSMKMDKNLDQAYGTLTGLSIQNEEDMPAYLCNQCSDQLMNFIRFRNRSLRAHLLLLEILRKQDCITLEMIQKLNGCQDVNSNIDVTQKSHFIDQDNLETVNNIKKETEYTDEQLLKSEPCSQDHVAHNIEKENEYLSNQDSIKEDTVYSSSLQEKTYLYDIKVENIETYNEGTMMTINDDAASDECGDLFEGDDGSDPDYNIQGEQKRNLNCNMVKTSDDTLLLYDKLCCDMCPYKTDSDKRLLRHLKTHTSTKSYNSNYSASNVIQKDNSKKNCFTCDLCKKTYSTRSGILKHMKSHSGEKPYMCDVCPKRFNDRRDLQNHLRTHSGEKPFGCDLCKKSFSERGNLLRHIRIHSGEKQYSCKFCKKSYNQKHHLKRHLTKYY